MADFGLSKIMNNKNKAKTICGTPEYLSPEILMKNSYGYEVDCWAMGCLVFEMIVGTPPFYSENPMELFEKIKYQEPIFPFCLQSSTKDLL